MTTHTTQPSTTASCQALTTPLPGAENGELPDHFQWMPPGESTIRPSVNGKAAPKPFKVAATPQLARAFNEQLQQIRAAARRGQGDEPYIDFNHADGERAGEITELYWAGEDPIKGGIRAGVIWSSAGREAVLGRTYRRFSPQWELDADTYEPVSISANLGGLVNRAAFRNIAPVIARQSTDPKQKQNNMEAIELTQAIAEALKPLESRLAALETRSADDATNPSPIARAVEAAMKPHLDKMAEVQASAVRSQARAAIQPHIDRGAIPPLGADAIKFWEDSWLANAQACEAQLNRLPGARSGRIIRGNSRDAGATHSGDPVAALIARAAETASAGKVNLAQALIDRARSPEGQEALLEFRKSFGSNSN